MKRSHLLLVVFLPIFSATVAAQSGQSNKTSPAKTVTANPEPAIDTEAERRVREREAHIESVLISLATDAGAFKDQRLRARTQSRIADGLWKNDPDRARSLFRKAWEAAEVADAELQQQIQKEIREQQAKNPGGGYSVSSPPELRPEVLRLAVKHDPALGEAFLAKLSEQKAQEGSANNRAGSQARDYAVNQRLGVAKQLLSDGDKERALQFADPLMETVSMNTIDFLSSLREKSPADADQRYAAMLSFAAASPQSDPNTASLLSSYIFTPHLYVMFIGFGGASQAHMSAKSVPAEVAPALRAAFFRAASQILMRPMPPPGQNQPSGTVINKYYVIKRLMPLFERFATAEATAGLRQQLEALSSMVTEDQRQKQEEPVRQGIRPQEPKQAPEQGLLEKVDQVKTSAERDALYGQLALNRAEAADLSARAYVDKIEEVELRRSARAYVDALLSYNAIGKRDAEQALEIARTGELTHLQRVWTMSRAANLLMRTDKARALQILDDATTEARRIGASDPDSPRAFLAIANNLFRIDRARGWDLMNDVVKAANSAPDFTGEGGKLAFQINASGVQSSHGHFIGEFDVANIFQSLAHENYERALELAQVFEREGPRANAVMAIALGSKK